METPKISSFIKTLSKAQLVGVLRQNFNESADENLSVEQLREILQKKISSAISQLVFESQPTPIPSPSNVKPPIASVEPDLPPSVPENSTKTSSKRTMSDPNKVELFRHNVDDWDTFVERMEVHFEANDTPPEKYVPELLTKVSNDTYTLIRNLVTPRKPKDLGFEELVKLVSDHLHPKPSEIVQRTMFSKVRQYPREPIIDFVARLKKCSLNCNFPDSDTRLRDQFVTGIKSLDTQSQLFNQKDLTFQSAVELALSREQAASNAPRSFGSYNGGYGRGRGRGRGYGYSRGRGRGGYQSGGYQSSRPRSSNGQNFVVVDYKDIPGAVPQNSFYNAIRYNSSQSRGRGGNSFQTRGGANRSQGNGGGNLQSRSANNSKSDSSKRQ